ncbi:MAG: hypothetical protein CM15mP120_25110 [Pseudomonadota bacterium]|nr:MAG: hypothetical protein CM15mP120_25110 [Pseudomonadota bacterium]
MGASFHPTPRTLMGPGPSDVHPRVLGAMGKATIGHLDPEFVALMEDIKELLRYCFKTKNTLTLPLSAPGSAAMEAAYANLLEPGIRRLFASTVFSACAWQRTCAEWAVNWSLWRTSGVRR